MRARLVADRFYAAVSSRFSCPSLAAVSLAFLATATCRAEESVPTLDGGDTAWMIVATALVLFITLPGLSLFYGGLVRSKNALSWAPAAAFPRSRCGPTTCPWP